MGFHVSHHVTMSFVGVIMILLCVKVDTQKFPEDDPDEVMQHGTSTFERKFKPDPLISNSELAARKPSVKKFNHFLWENRDSYHLSRLLSPDTFSNPDPFLYLIRETTKLSRWTIETLGKELVSRLNYNNEFPKPYIPYAQALRSILRAQVGLNYSKENIQGIATDRDPATVPDEVSSPPALSESGLFSRDIFSDPNPPIRLLKKLMEIPKNDIPNITIQLENYAKMSIEWREVPYKWWRYISYAKELAEFLRKDILDDLKRNMDNIRSISTTSHQNADNIRSNNEPNSS